MLKNLEDLTLKEIKNVCSNHEYCHSDEGCPLIDFCYDILGGDDTPLNWNLSGEVYIEE